MKIGVFLIFLSIGVASASSTHSQNAALSLKIQNKTLKDVFREIENQSDYIFFYNDEAVNVNKRVDVSVDKATINEVMDIVLDKRQSGYKIVDRQVILFKSSAVAPIIETTITKEDQQQKFTVTGIVKSKTGEPIIGATVVEKGTTNGVHTDVNGNYSISVASPTTTLQFSSIGYNKVDQKINSRNVINIIVEEETSNLDDVVVIGYQSVQKKFTTGTVTSIKAEDMANLPTASLSSLLAGKTTGLMSMNLGGGPGSTGALVIRGNAVVSGSLGEANQFSNPLYVIDGVPTTLEEVAGYGKTNNDFLSSLNIEDIETIDVLKDASAAAIYGSRGANGVIIIKTKTGQAGKMRVTLKASTTINVRPELTKTPIGAAERRMKMGLINDTWTYAAMQNSLPILLTDSLNPSFNNNMNYQDLFYQTGVTQIYDAAIRGGAEELNYRLGVGYYDEEGVIKNTGFKRYSLNLNITQKPWQRVTNQTIITGSYQDRKPGSGDSKSRGNFPVTPWDMNSSLLSLTDDQYNFLTGTLSDYYRTDRTMNVQGTNILNVDIWNGIIFNSQISGVFNSNKRNQFQPASISKDNLGYAKYEYYERLGTNLEHYLSFSQYIKEKHHLNVLAGMSYEYNRNESIYMDAYGGSGDMIKTISAYRKEDINGNTAISENAMLSYWGRLGYRFMDRYQLDLNYRRDASSKFGRNKRWGNFYSFGAYWMFHDESFMKFAKDWLSFAKIKYTYGRNGKQFPDDYLRYNMYTLSYNGFYGMGTGNLNPSTYGGILAAIPDFKKLADDNLSWETSIQTDLGIDLEFFKNRLYVSANYYNRNTDGLLFDVKFPDYTGFDYVKTNVAGVRNSGWEVSLDGHLFPRNNDLTLQISTGFSGNKNVITKLPNNNRDYLNYDPDAVIQYGYVVGKPGPLLYGFIYDGPLKDINDLPVNPFTGVALDPTKGGVWGKVGPGYPMFRDVSGDYLVSDENDQDVLMTDFDPNPKVMGYLNFNVGYKEWNLRVNSNFVFGRDVYNEVGTKILNRYDNQGAWVPKAMINVPDYDFWSPSNPNGYFPNLVLTESGSGIPSRYAFRGGSTMWFEDGSYWKLNDITLSYNFKREWLKRTLKLERLYVYVTAYNVWQWQKSDKLLDASMVDSRGYAIGDGYPNPRRYTIGINVEF